MKPFRVLAVVLTALCLIMAYKIVTLPDLSKERAEAERAYMEAVRRNMELEEELRCVMGSY